MYGASGAGAGAREAAAVFAKGFSNVNEAAAAAWAGGDRGNEGKTRRPKGSSVEEGAKAPMPKAGKAAPISKAGAITLLLDHA